MTRTALYIRFSSARQVGGASLPDQLARLRADCAAAGETITGEYVDQARSGTSAARRPAYQQLLADARTGAFERVRVESVDRGHRNDTERRQFELELSKLRISVVYAGEATVQAPEFRKFNRGIKGVVAELESDVASQRTYKRHLHRAKQGKWRGGSYPYGAMSNGSGWMQPEPGTYDTLLWILERRAEGIGYHSIAKLAGRANRPGSCTTPMLSAEALELAVVTAIFTRGYLPAEMRGRVSAAIETARRKVLGALDILEEKLKVERRRQADALESLTDRSLSPLVRQAMVQHAEQVIQEVERLDGEQRTLRAGIGALDGQARSVDTLLNDPNLDPARWREPTVYQSLKRLFHYLIHKAELRACNGGGFVVELQVHRVLSPQGREIRSNESTLDHFQTTVLFPRRVGADVDAQSSTDMT